MSFEGDSDCHLGAPCPRLARSARCGLDNHLLWDTDVWDTDVWDTEATRVRFRPIHALSNPSRRLASDLPTNLSTGHNYRVLSLRHCERDDDDSGPSILYNGPAIYCWVDSVIGQ